MSRGATGAHGGASGRPRGPAPRPAHRPARGTPARARRWARALATLGVAIAVSGCRTTGAVGPRAGDEGLTVVIHAGRAPGTPALAHVDERRWREVPAAGEVALGPVAAGVVLDSVVVEAASGPGELVARACRVEGAAAGLHDPAWLWGREVEVGRAGGEPLTGVVVEVGELVALVDDGEARAAVPVAGLRLDPEAAAAAAADDDDGGAAALRAVAGHDPVAGPAPRPGPTPRLGDAVIGSDRDGRESHGRLVAIGPSHLVLRAAGGGLERVDLDRALGLRVVGAPAAPTLVCRVTARRPGRQLVRVAYVATGLTWQATHVIAALPSGGEPGAVDHVTVQPWFTVASEGLPGSGPAQLRLVLGLPDEPAPPVTVWEGTATVGGPARAVPGAASRRRARVVRVYRGARAEDTPGPRHPAWRAASTTEVWRELAFERLDADPPGAVRVAVDGASGRSWVDGALAATAAARAVRVTLGPEPDLVGFRHKLGHARRADLVDELRFSVANRGERALEVVIEEELRDLGRPALVVERLDGRDGGGALMSDRWQARVVVPAAGQVQGHLVLRYRLR